MGVLMKVETVWVQIRPPLGADAGLVELGHYKILEDGAVQMCREDGKPTGHKVTVGPGERPQRIAARLTKEAWHKRNKEVSSFNRPIVYPVWKPA
jgi:hypothetical protein